MESFLERRSVRAVPRDDHVSHLEGITPPIWESMACKRAVNIPPDRALLLLGSALNTVLVVKKMSPILTVL